MREMKFKKSVSLLIKLFVFSSILFSAILFAEEEKKDEDENISSITAGIVDPDEYIIGPGDALFVSVRGVFETTSTLVVNPENSIYIPRLGILKLDNITLKQGKEIIKDAFLKKFKDVEIDVILTGVRKINVNLVGFVGKPSVYSIYASARLSQFLLTAGNLPDDADLRNIEVITDDVVNKYDLLSFLKLGVKSENPYLTDGCIVKVNKTDKNIVVFGQVANPGNFPFVEDEKVSSLIELCGGLTHRAYTDSIEIVRFIDDYNQTSLYYNIEQLDNVIVQNRDFIIIREKSLYQIARTVKVAGRVKYPGVYKIEKGKTRLKEVLIEQAGGFLEDASLKDAYIFRPNGITKTDPEFERLQKMDRADMSDDEYNYLKAMARQRKGFMVVDFEKLFYENNADENILLKTGDEIVIPEKVNHVRIVGQVLNPGNIVFNKNFTINDYIEAAGGFGWRAVEDDIRLISGDSGEWLESDEVEVIHPGDIIWIPEEPPSPRFWEVFMDTLTILAQTAAVITSVVAIIVATRN